jgi:hypothetical protein
MTRKIYLVTAIIVIIAVAILIIIYSPHKISMDTPVPQSQATSTEPSNIKDSSSSVTAKVKVQYTINRNPTDEATFKALKTSLTFDDASGHHYETPAGFRVSIPGVDKNGKHYTYSLDSGLNQSTTEDISADLE